MSREIVVFGHGDRSARGFRTRREIEAYLGGAIFRIHRGRYRYTVATRARIIVLSQDGFAYGELQIEEAVAPGAEDRRAYPPVKKVYLVSKATLYGDRVRLYPLGARVHQFGTTISKSKLARIRRLAGIGRECCA